MEFNHISVLLEESVSALDIKPDGVYVDCTAGGGGHSAQILSHLNENGRMYLFDRDPDAIKVITERFKGDKRVTIIHDNYSNIKLALDALGVSAVDGIVADLGVSSFQLDTAERGFSFHNDAELDMRMSKIGLSAKDVVNTYSENELFKVITEYGEEKFARKIASNIVKAREKKEIETTFQLSEIISNSIPAKFKRDGHPARKTFQAIRIEVNNELGGLKAVLPDMFGEER
jgi:16S rRNA (cytosine1402-N4)-methyltransferase